MRPARVGHPRLAVPTTEAVVEALAADAPVGEVVTTRRRHLLDRQHMLVDRPHRGHLRVDAGFWSAWEIGVLAEAARHRLIAGVAAFQIDGQACFAQREVLPGLIKPGPLPRFMCKCE